MEKKTGLYFLLLLLMVSLLTLGGCKDEEDSDVSPSGTSSVSAEMVLPTADSTGDAAVSTNIAVTFDAEMIPDTINENSFVVKEKDSTGDAVSGVFSYSADSRTYTFDPSTDLETDATYDVEITTSVKDSYGNYFSGDTWTFKTSKAAGVYMPFSFGPQYEDCTGTLVETVIVDNSSSDITITVFDKECAQIATSSFTLSELAVGTELTVENLYETETHTDKNGDMVMSGTLLDLTINSSGGNYYWASVSTFNDHVLGPEFRQLAITGDPDTVLIRNKQDKTVEILALGDGVDTKILAFSEGLQVVNDYSTPVELGIFKWNYLCDGSATCAVDPYIMMKDSTAGEYVSTVLNVAHADYDEINYMWLNVYFYLTDTTNSDASSNFSKVILNGGMDRVSGYTDHYDTTTDAGYWIRSVDNCAGNYNGTGSAIAYYGNNYTAFVQFVSATESTLDTVSAKVVEYQKIGGEWTLLANELVTVEENTPLNRATLVTIEVDDNSTYCYSGDSSKLIVKVPSDGSY